MKFSNFFIPTLKESPSDVKMRSHDLMIRSGMIRQETSGIYSWMPLGFRVLKKIYVKVSYVRNITDVDDKIIEASKNKKKPINQITDDVTKVFHENCKSLNCLTPTKEPKATDHIDEMVKMTESLIKKKFAYEVKGHVYFSVSSFKKYGKLSNKDLDELKAGSRIEVSKLKKNH